MAAKPIVLVAALALSADGVARGQGSQTDLAEVRFKAVGEDGLLTVEADGREVKLTTIGVLAMAAGQPIQLRGLLPGTMVQLTYQYRGDGRGAGIAERCQTAAECAATQIRLDYESSVWRNEFAFGVEFSQERDDFSKQDPVLNYRSDTLLWESRSGKCRLHLGFNLGFMTIPNEEATEVTEGEMAAAREDTTTSFEAFLASRKSLSLSLDLNFPFGWRFGGEDVLNLGPFLRGGLNTITDFESPSASETGPDGTPSPGMEDTVNHFFNAGVRFAHHRRTLRGTNPEILRFIEIGYGYYESFFDQKQLALIGLEAAPSRRHRLIINAHLRIPGSMPIYAGVRANVGSGRDDVRAHVALRFDFNRLVALASPDRVLPLAPAAPAEGAAAAPRDQGDSGGELADRVGTDVETPHSTPEPEVGASCPEPVPTEQSDFNLKTHGPRLWDATPRVGRNQADYCRRAGFTDGRGTCAVRPDGHPDRVACETRLLGGDPVWTCDGQPAEVNTHNRLQATCDGRVKVCNASGTVCAEGAR